MTEKDMVKFDVAPRSCLGGADQCLRSIQQAPEINVTFADKSKDTLELTHHKMKADSPMRCNYLGNLRHDRASVVAVTGCLDKPGDKMEVTMFSTKAKNMMYTVDYNGNTEAIKGAFEDGGIRIYNFNILSLSYEKIY